MKKIIHSKLPSSEYFDYVENERNLINKELNKQRLDISFRKSLSRWIETYDLIKGDNWPVCTNFEDFDMLPDWVQQECTHQHKFNPTIWYKTIQDSMKQYDYPNIDDQCIDRFEKIILDNLEYITNKHIIDFSAYLGHLSFICAKNKSISVKATDIRKENISIINKSIEKFSVGNITAELADIHDYTNNTLMCSEVDTVLLCGIMYHVHDHYCILESITNASPQCIIIEVVENKSIMAVDAPLIYWTTENTEDVLAGWYNEEQTILVGYPNTAWFVLACQQLGYHRISTKQYDFKYQFKDDEVRSVHVFVKH
jgi:hypothetical protein